MKLPKGVKDLIDTVMINSDIANSVINSIETLNDVGDSFHVSYKDIMISAKNQKELIITIKYTNNKNKGYTKNVTQEIIIYND